MPSSLRNAAEVEVGENMKKWYAPCRFLLAAALATQLMGCASTSRTVGRWMGRDKADEQLADVDSRAKSAEKKDSKSSKADTKVADSSSKSKKSGSTTSVSAKDDVTVADSRASRPKAEVAGKSDKLEPSTKTAKKPADVEARVASAKDLPTKPKVDPISEFDEFPIVKATPKAKPLDPFEDFTEADLTQEAPEMEPKFGPIGTAKLSNGVLKPPSANRQVAQGTQVLASASQTTVAEFETPASNSGLPEWALDEPEMPIAKAEQKPVISQVNATQFQPGQPAPEDQRLRFPEKKVIEIAPAMPPSMLALCPEANGEVRELVKALDTKDPESLKRTIHRLGRMQSHAEAATPALRALQQHPDGFVRVHAALALVRMGHVSSDVTQTLIAGLRSPDPGVRSFSAAVLAEMGPHSADALPALSAALNDSDGYVRLHVAEVLIRHADWSHAALNALNDSLKNSDENVRWLATYSLAELAPQSEVAVEALQQSLHDPVTKVQTGAAYALGEIGPVASSALPDLERCAASPNADLRAAAEYAITQIRQ
ncbi:hypothetical protein GC163_06660 [bacterium]|nr:hypothetical protein [bacterium]